MNPVFRESLGPWSLWLSAAAGLITLTATISLPPGSRVEPPMLVSLHGRNQSDGFDISLTPQGAILTNAPDTSIGKAEIFSNFSFTGSSQFLFGCPPTISQHKAKLGFLFNGQAFADAFYYDNDGTLHRNAGLGIGVDSMTSSVDGGGTTFTITAATNQNLRSEVFLQQEFIAKNDSDSATFTNLSLTADTFTDFVAPAVPEISTWTMMIVGFFGLGAVASRKTLRASTGHRSDSTDITWRD
jgi:hypothetical protein